MHGAFADASGFGGVIRELSASGYRVLAPPNSLRGLAGDAATVSAVVGAIDGPVVLVGHSYGGAVITQASATLDNVAGLVKLMGQAQAACAAFNQPALFLYGGHDELIPPEAMRRCWQALPKPALDSSKIILAFYPPDYHLIERDLERATPDADITGYILGTGLASSAPSDATIFLAGF